MDRIGYIAALTAVVWFAALNGPAAARGEAVSESESNDTVVVADALAAGQFGEGTVISISANDDLDFWKVGGAEIGDLIFAYAEGVDMFFLAIANDGSLNFDYDRDDGPPPGPSSGAVLAGASVPQTGNVNYFVDSFQSSVSYRLFQATVDPADQAAESESNDDALSADSIRASVMTGEVSGADLDYFKFSAPAGARLVVIMDEDPENDGQTDALLNILSTDGVTTIASGDNSVLPGPGPGIDVREGNAAGSVAAPATGTFFVSVANGGNPAATDTSYRFVVLVDGALAAVDPDEDGIDNGTDNCPADPNSDQTDADTDGVGDVCDNCPDVPNPNQAERDEDGVGDACDKCPGFDDGSDGDGDGTANGCDECAEDPDKTDDGICGCGVPDSDADSDGVPACFDECPNDPDKTAPGACGCGESDADSDGDGVPGCFDECPEDGKKLEPGVCGCGAADEDTDGDLILDCNDNCPESENGDQLDADGDGMGDACDNAPDDPNPDQEDTDGDGTPDVIDDMPNGEAPAPLPGDNCGATTCGPTAGSMLPLTLIGLARLRRRTTRRRS